MGFKETLALTYIRTKFTLLSILSKRKAAKAAFDLFCTPRIRNRKDLPPLFKKAEIIRFDFEGYHIQGYRWNKDGAKTIQILHGFESSVVNFDHFIQPLIDKGYCVLAFDAPAHGRSSGRQINVITYKEFIRYIFDHYGPVQHYICHSFGGLSLSLALEEMPHDENSKVVLIAPATETSTAIDQFFSFLHLSQSLREPFDKIIEDKSGHIPTWFSVVRALKHSKAQVLWIHDRDDDMTPIEDAAKIKEYQLPNIRFMETQGLGHRRIYRDKEISKSVLDFFN